MKSFTFNNIKKNWLYLLKGRQKAPFAALRRNTITVPGMDGAHLSSTEADPIVINQPVGFVVDNDEHALQLKDELAGWLYTKEPVPLEFDDEPGRTYYAVVQNTLDDFDRFAEFRQGTIQFLCLDPYKYGPEQTQELDDITTVENKGTAEADPIFELTAKKKSTFAMVSLGADEDSGYNLIGTPADDDVEVVDEKTSVMYENGSTLEKWEKPSMDMIDDPNVSNIGGELGSGEIGIRPNPYGPSGSGQRGGALTRELTSNIQDFELETTFDIISRREKENWRMMIYLHDENLNSIGQIGVKDNSRLNKRRVPLATAGPHSAGYEKGRVLGDRSDYNDNARNTTLFYLRAKREGNKFSFYIGEWKNFRHINSWEGTYRDIDGSYLGKLKYITLFIGSYQDRSIPYRIRMNSVELFELTQVEEDRTPYILRKDDVVTFDHKDEKLLINGEVRKDLKNIGASFFKLKKGFNNVVITPQDAFDSKVTFRSKYK